MNLTIFLAPDHFEMGYMTNIFFFYFVTYLLPSQTRVCVTY